MGPVQYPRFAAAHYCGQVDNHKIRRKHRRIFGQVAGCCDTLRCPRYLSHATRWQSYSLRSFDFPSNLLNLTKPVVCDHASIKCLSAPPVLISSYQQPRHAPRRTPVAIRRPWWPLMAHMDSLIQIHLHRDYIHDTEIDLLSPFP